MASDTNTPKFHIAIVGGGIAGITLAIALMKHNISCAIYEQGHAFSEIGAGVAFSPNAVWAMKICDKTIHTAFEKVATHNQWPSKKNVFFDFIDGTTKSIAEPPATVFSLTNEQGANSVHRADFMEEMAQLVPGEIAHFRKHLDDIAEDPSTGKLRLKFHDGTVAEADAVVGCDGIKSRTRAVLFGDDHPSAHPTYTHKYAYRAVVPMEKAVEVIGDERAQNASLWMGPKSHVLTFPITQGKTFNLVAFQTDEGEWPSSNKLTLPAHKTDALRDFKNFGPAVLRELELTNEDIDRWAIFDLGDHPVPSFYKGRICISGDAAHATSPHHGAGAGFCIEDSAVLSSLLADERVRSHRDLEAVFAAFDAARRERAQWLVQDSRRTGELYEWNAEGAGKDLKKIEDELRNSYAVIWNYDMDKAVEDAKAELGSRLKT
ncbi:hypothetical protein SLS62_002525 [Diatrype stigma]|uniref:FAD-binding domain-containing protein n=1 Tax=Diatrype stigma TaxID=117547 RepID=A0AAN9V0B2_9PEZI